MRWPRNDGCELRRRDPDHDLQLPYQSYSRAVQSMIWRSGELVVPNSNYRSTLSRAVPLIAHQSYALSPLTSDRPPTAGTSNTEHCRTIRVRHRAAIEGRNGYRGHSAARARGTPKPRWPRSALGRIEWSGTGRTADLPLSGGQSTHQPMNQPLSYRS